jgi:hypothetical protein
MVFTCGSCCPKDASPPLFFPSSWHGIALHSIASLRLSYGCFVLLLQKPTRRTPTPQWQIALATQSICLSLHYYPYPEIPTGGVVPHSLLVPSLTRIVSAYQTRSSIPEQHTLSLNPTIQYDTPQRHTTTRRNFKSVQQLSNLCLLPLTERESLSWTDHRSPLPSNRAGAASNSPSKPGSVQSCCRTSRC